MSLKRETERILEHKKVSKSEIDCNKNETADDDHCGERKRNKKFKKDRSGKESEDET